MQIRRPLASVRRALCLQIHLSTTGTALYQPKMKLSCCAKSYSRIGATYWKPILDFELSPAGAHGARITTWVNLPITWRIVGDQLDREHPGLSGEAR